MGKDPVCCGGSAIDENSDLRATGDFKRAKVYFFTSFTISKHFFPQAGGLISVKATGSLDDCYPPGRVSDFTLGSMNFTENTFGLSFTWPGNQLDQGTVAGFKVKNERSCTIIHSLLGLLQW